MESLLIGQERVQKAIEHYLDKITIEKGNYHQKEVDDILLFCALKKKVSFGY